MKHKEKILIIVFIVALISLIGIASYAYFSPTVNNSANQDVVTAGIMAIEFSDGQEVNLENAIPGSSIAKSFSIKNTGNVATNYDVYLTDVINNFSDQSDLVYAITSTDGGYQTESDQQVPSKADKIISNYVITPGVTQHYILTIKFINKEESQDDNQGKTFSAKIQVNELDLTKACDYSYAYSGDTLTVSYGCKDNFGCKTALSTATYQNVNIENYSDLKWNIVNNYDHSVECSCNITKDYTVNNYQMNMDGTYPDTPTEVTTAKGLIGSSVSSTPKDYDGFVTPDVQTITISHTDENVINYKYERKKYTLTVNTYDSNTSKYNTDFSTYFSYDLMNNNILIADDSSLTSYQLYYGSTYEFSDLKATSNYSYVGLYSGNNPGTINGDTMVSFNVSSPIWHTVVSMTTSSSSWTSPRNALTRITIHGGAGGGFTIATAGGSTDRDWSNAYIGIGTGQVEQNDVIKWTIGSIGYSVYIPYDSNRRNASYYTGAGNPSYAYLNNNLIATAPGGPSITTNYYDPGNVGTSSGTGDGVTFNSPFSGSNSYATNGSGYIIIEQYY